MQLFKTRKPLLGAILSIFILGTYSLWGPHPIRLAQELTGEAELANQLKAQSIKGQRNLSAFVIDNQSVHYAGIGFDENSEVEIGSITKTMTAEVLRKQVERGEIRLDTTVGEVLSFSDSPVASVTVEELARHTSGLPRVALTPRFFLARVTNSDPYKGQSQADVILHAKKAKLKGRGEYSYSNLGFALLGAVLSQNSGMDYADLVEKEIFAPLGMNDSFVMRPSEITSSTPRGISHYGHSADPWASEGIAAAGGVRSTAADISKYARHLLEAGVPDYTWVKDDETGYMWHNGGTGGYSSMLVLDLKAKRASFVVGDTPASTDELGFNLLGGEQ